MDALLVKARKFTSTFSQKKRQQIVGADVFPNISHILTRELRMCNERVIWFGLP